jgi:hypothetical protein
VLALHLRPGTREWFHTWLAREHPELLERYAALYRRGAYVDAAYRRDLAARVTPLLERHGLTGGGHAMGGRQGGDSGSPEAYGERIDGLEGKGGWPDGAMPPASPPSVPEAVVTAPPEQLSLL